MTRFFIDTNDGNLITYDEEGMDLADARAACDMALATLPEMAKHGIGTGGYGPFSALVRNESGDPIYSASLKLDEEWLVASQ